MARVSRLMTGLARLGRFCLVPLRGDGEAAKHVGRRIRAEHNRRSTANDSGALGEKTGEEFAEKLRTARYEDWKNQRRQA